MVWGIDESLNWIINHWYYFVIIFLMGILYRWFVELKKFRGQFTHWCEERQERVVKEEKVNPTLTFKWLTKQKLPLSTDVKKIGKIDTWKVEPQKAIGKNPGIINHVTVTAKTRHLGNFIWWHPQVFVFQLENVKPNEHKKTVMIPYNYYWEKQPDGTMALIAPDFSETIDFVNEKVYKDLHTTAIDGYAAQMVSFSSVKPTWGHEERTTEKENEGRALGIGGFLKSKKSEKEEKD